MTEKIIYIFSGLLLLIGAFGFLQSSFVIGLGLDNGHNAIHVISGLGILAMACFWKARVKLSAKILGVLYAFLTVLGLFTVMSEPLMKIFNLNPAHTVLHVILASAFLYIGFIAKDKIQNTERTN